jgi:hypothetical protein
MEVEANDTLLFLDDLVMKRGPKLAIKVYWKCIHIGRYLYTKSNHPHHMKRGVIYNSSTQAICQNQKGFNKDIKNLGHDLMFNEYPQEFVDSIMKPSRSNCPSDSMYQGMVIIPYVKGISGKVRRIGCRFYVRTIFQTKHRLHEALMKTGPVRHALQMKQCVCNIPCDCYVMSVKQADL